LGIGEECLIVNALQAFVKEKQTINKEREKTKNSRDKYIKWLNEMYDIGLSAVRDSKEDIYNVPLCGQDRIAELQRSTQAHTPKDYQDAIQESNEDFIIPI
jgi:hypothetical protein